MNVVIVSTAKSSEVPSMLSHTRVSGVYVKTFEREGGRKVEGEWNTLRRLLFVCLFSVVLFFSLSIRGFYIFLFVL